uniref:ORF95 lef-4 n=1 Tax=Cydia pomonella granulosis virus TaxID=28289 RepID=A0A097P167_GVCP|nr:ORF95 lef-4 [Cydia pomonella granulovirus]WOZ30319.1 DNA-dependent RNA polymerase subunit LEF-4 [Cydia pomonella granulovirus]WOZ30444.1 DNA-dependent RNA polymerase subunit LEF-4 [Cydia pomonella granulovirus]WOZ30576.1 DNA-dependent RNA polymerase subunit LEF-4 [Cydia pomonella granulovirus]WOZ45214.1 DNA-dependent RNA polymerase subunit LEF-4 [Cydia pomonella granulovirus]
MSEREQEISYTFTYSQDVLYRLKGWLDVNLCDAQSYVEVYDTNDVRTRIYDGGVMSTVKKRLVESGRVVVMVGDNFVPMINRECHETIYRTCGERLKRVCQTRVYKSNNDIEIKFEQIYYEHNVGDTLDPLTASKQLTMYNLLQPDNAIDVTSNSHLGSDEILANCRLELEYEGSVNGDVLCRAAHLINHIEGVVLRDVIISPFISHTSLFNEICYRPFTNELIIGQCGAADIKLWALKLDGVRGKAYIVNGVRMFVQLDDMQMFSGRVERSDDESELTGRKSKNFKIFRFCRLNSDSCTEPPEQSSGAPPFLHNRIVCFQVEYLAPVNTFYLTDVISVYKYKYDNRNQYDVSAGVGVDVADAVNFLNAQHTAQLVTSGGQLFRVECQEFHANVKNVNVDRATNDGFVGVTHRGGLVKVKTQKSFEMKYTGDNSFVCSFGEFSCVDGGGEYRRGKIYEVIIVQQDKVKVLKERPDRLISN